MNCFVCKRPINRGTELAKAIMEYVQPDGSIKTYGWDRPDGKLSMFGGTTTGKLVRAYHYKHYRVAEKREHRGGDAVSGRGMGSIPTAYEITALTANQDELVVLGITEEQARETSTRSMSDKVQAVRAQSIAEGTGSDNWAVKERVRADEHGGPYEHRHMFPMERFQLPAHVQYAHGLEESFDGLTTIEMRQRHNELHAAMELEKTRVSRAGDPGYKEGEETDWRHQEVREISELPVVVEADLTGLHTDSGEELSFEQLHEDAEKP